MKKNILIQAAFLFCLTIIISINCSAEMCKVTFGCHACGAKYTCSCPGWICIGKRPTCKTPNTNSTGMQLGKVTLEESAMGMGNIDLTVLNETQLHFVFYHDLEIPVGSDSLLPIDSTFAINQDISNALGYDSIILKRGNYPVNFSNYQYGEANISVILFGKKGPTLSQWGLLIVGIVLLVALSWFIFRKRKLVTSHHKYLRED